MIQNSDRTLVLSFDVLSSTAEPAGRGAVAALCRGAHHWRHRQVAAAGARVRRQAMAGVLCTVDISGGKGRRVFIFQVCKVSNICLVPRAAASYSFADESRHFKFKREVVAGISAPVLLTTSQVICSLMLCARLVRSRRQHSSVGPNKLGVARLQKP